MKTKYKVWLTIIILVSGIVCGFVLSFHYSDKVSRFIGDRQLARAEKFMDQMNYEQAVIAFQSAIKIEPRRKDAYMGLASAYQEMGKTDEAVQVLAAGYKTTKDREVSGQLEEVVLIMYEGYMEDGDYDKAEKILEFLYEITGDRETKKKIDDLKDQEKLDQKSREILERLYKACEAGNMDYVKDIMNTQDYQTLIVQAGDRITYPSATGRAVAVFNNKALYYGELKDGKRDGSGIWIKSDGESTNIYDGQWSKDMPEGSGTVTFTKYSAGGSVIYTARTNGTFSKGKENGSMTLVHMQNNETNTFHYTASGGIAEPMNGVVQNRSNSQYVVAVSREHSENEFVTTASEEYGVYGFISGAGSSAIPIS